MPEQLNALSNVFISQLKDMHSAETQLVEALPKMASAATTEELTNAFEEHLNETKGQVKRLEQVFSSIEAEPGGNHCKAMEGLIAEGEEIINKAGEPEAKDAALICGAQKVEHYEIATYGTLREYARILGHSEAQRLLEENLNEEKAADKLLTKLAEQSINEKAVHAAR